MSFQATARIRYSKRSKRSGEKKCSGSVGFRTRMPRVESVARKGIYRFWFDGEIFRPPQTICPASQAERATRSSFTTSFWMTEEKSPAATFNLPFSSVNSATTLQSKIAGMCRTRICRIFPIVLPAADCPRCDCVLLREQIASWVLRHIRLTLSTLAGGHFIGCVYQSDRGRTVTYTHQAFLSWVSNSQALQTSLLSE